MTVVQEIKGGREAEAMTLVWNFFCEQTFFVVWNHVLAFNRMTLFRNLRLKLKKAFSNQTNLKDYENPFKHNRKSP